MIMKKLKILQQLPKYDMHSEQKWHKTTYSVQDCDKLVKSAISAKCIKTRYISFHFSVSPLQKMRY